MGRALGWHAAVAACGRVVAVRVQASGLAALSGTLGAGDSRQDQAEAEVGEAGRKCAVADDAWEGRIV
jgi:hypothetical protein